MTQVEHLDALVLGSGPGGNLLAWHLARSGQRVAVVERRYIGGSCPNIACMPSKNEIWSARIAHLVRHAAQFGTITRPVTTDMAKARKRKRDMVERETAAHVAPFKSSGAELVMGSGSGALRPYGGRVLALTPLLPSIPLAQARPRFPLLERRFRSSPCGPEPEGTTTPKVSLYGTLAWFSLHR